MGYLAGKRIYLSGPIEFANQDNWRIEPKKILATKFKLNLIDPFTDPKQQWADRSKGDRELRSCI